MTKEILISRVKKPPAPLFSERMHRHLFNKKVVCTMLLCVGAKQQSVFPTILAFAFRTCGFVWFPVFEGFACVIFKGHNRLGKTNILIRKVAEDLLGRKHINVVGQCHMSMVGGMFRNKFRIPKLEQKDDVLKVTSKKIKMKVLEAKFIPPSVCPAEILDRLKKECGSTLRLSDGRVKYSKKVAMP
jgi:hypothetical protein